MALEGRLKKTPVAEFICDRSFSIRNHMSVRVILVAQRLLR